MDRIDNPELSPRSKLKAQLAVVDRAIEKLVNNEGGSKTRLSSPLPDLRAKSSSKKRLVNAGSSLIASFSSSRLPVVPDFLEKDESYKIVTTGLQAVVCPYCGDEVDAKLLEHHKVSSCSNRLVKCPNSDCGLTIHLKQMKYHLKNECIAIKNRNKILVQAQQRAMEEKQAEEERLKQFEIIRQQEAVKTIPQSTENQNTARPPSPIKMVLCPDCSESMRESMLSRHIFEECRFRKVMCPNYGFGCKEQSIPLVKLQEHINNECNAEKHRLMMYMKSKHRFEKLQCATCGEMVMLKDWRKHENEGCENRLVPCKNHNIGCQVLVPKKERSLHEHLDENYARHCLYFSGHGSHLYLNENDILFPWCAEFWLYRPIAQEALKTHIRNFLMQIPSYLIAYSTEFILKEKVLRLVTDLKEEVGKSKEEQLIVSQLSKAERQIWQQEKVEQRMFRVNELQALIPVYSDAVVAYLKTWQSLAICIEAGMTCISECEIEYKNNKEALDALLIDLKTNYPGEVGTVNKGSNYFASPKSNMKGDIDIRHENRATTADSVYSASQELDTLPDSNSLAASSADTETIQTFPNSLIPNIVYNDLEQVETKLAVYRAEGIKQSYLAQQMYASCTTRLKQIFAEEEAKKKQEEGEEETKDEGKEDSKSIGELSVHSARSAHSMHSTHSTYSQRAMLSKQNSSTMGKISKQNSSSILLQECSDNQNLNAESVLPVEDLDDPLLDTIFQNIEHESLIACPTYARFLLDYHLIGGKLDGMEGHHYGLVVWRDLLGDMIKVMKSDFDQLQDWRIETGLLTPDVKSETKFGKKKPNKKDNANPLLKLVGTESAESSDIDSEADASLNDKESKKEKAARKKEKERQRRELKKIKLVQEEMEKKLQEKQQNNGATSTTNAPSTNPSSSKLLTRCTELFRANSGAEILMESTTANTSSQRSRICLAMYSGLSLLSEDDKASINQEDLVEKKNHHYELLLPPKELYKLSAMKGAIGHVYAHMDPGTLTEKIGSQPVSYGLKIPRGRWTHVAITTSKQKMTFFLDGKMIYVSKETPLPLPMCSIGGTPHSLLSYQGLLLDVRLWNHLRSEKQISYFMHRLLDLEKKKVSDGCIAWYTMEDGPGFALLTDLTRHRFKTPIMNSVSYTLSYLCNQSVTLPLSYVSELPQPLQHFIPKNIWKEIGQPELYTKHMNKVRSFEKHRLSVGKYHWIKAETVQTYTKMPATLLKNIENSQRSTRTNSNLPFYLLESLNKGIGKPNSHEGDDNQTIKSESTASQFGANYASILPLPSYREMNICPFEIRKVKLAQSGRLLQKRHPCPLSCGEEIRVFEKRYHVRYVCPRRLVKCRFDFCPCMYPAEEQDIHENSNGCEHMAERIKWLNHAAYSHRLIECTQCHEKQLVKDLEEHMKKECEYRNIYCPYRDCEYGEQNNKQPGLGAHRLEHHLKYDCTSNKRKMLFLLVERARDRHPYPRPWGLTVEAENLANEVDNGDGKVSLCMTDSLSSAGELELNDEGVDELERDET